MGVHIKFGLFLCVCWLAASSAFHLGNAKSKKEFYKNLLSLNKEVNDSDLDSYESKLAKLKHRLVEKDSTFKNYRSKLAQVITEKLTKVTDNRQVVNGKKTHVSEVPRWEDQNGGMEKDLFMGDILLTEEQLNAMLASEEGGRKKRQISTQFPKWTSTVSYYFDPAASWTTTEKATIRTGFDFWHDNTCLNFVENSGATNKIRIFRGIGCYATLGMVGGTQGMSLGNNCVNPGTASHEMGHALGIWHQQSRYDRNSSITVNPQHIIDDKEDQYIELTAAISTNLNMPYDYGSVMHYGDGGSFSTGTGPTMTALNPLHQKTMGQREGPSFFDMLLINTRYNCLSTCSPLACQNNGYANPANCATCLCPVGTAGTLCDQRPAKTSANACTGGTINATTSWQNLTGSINLPFENNLPMESCYYWINAPAGSVLEIDLISIELYGSEVSLEVKAQDLRFVGYKFGYTGSWGVNSLSSVPVIVSETNRVILKFQGDWGTSNFKLSYRYKTTGATQPTTTTTTTKATTTTTKAPTTTTTQASSCVDLDSNCLQWQSEGDCEPGSEWREWAEENCAKTCGFCSSPTTTTTKATTTTTKATTTTTTTQPSTCVDIDSNCEQWQSEGDCEEGSEWYEWAQENCSMTCGFCSNCADVDENCDQWQSEGDCEEGSEWREWAEENCAQTCGFC